MHRHPKHSLQRLAWPVIGMMVLAILLVNPARATKPEILSPDSEHYLPDFSYAGYDFGESEPRLDQAETFDVTDFGATPNDGKDDSHAILAAVEAAHEAGGPAVIYLPPGRFILSEIVYLERSHLVLRGAGSGLTEIHFPRPMMYLPDPPALKELREYLIRLEKRQRTPSSNIDLPFSQYSWAGGFIWVRAPGERVKAYLEDYRQPFEVLAEATGGKRGDQWLEVTDTRSLQAGDVVRINWHNESGDEGPLLDSLYQGADVTIGPHHWTQPHNPLVTQQVKILEIEGNRVKIKDTLMHDANASGQPAKIARWPHLEQVGIESLEFSFPKAPHVAHHVEQGFNAIYLTRLFNGWVQDVKIHNADSGVITDEIANVTIRDIITTGTNKGHYSVHMGDTHNVLVQNLKVHNEVFHPLSFNTHATRSIYSQCQVFKAPVLDQHSGANHQNLFDDIQVELRLSDEQREERRHPLLRGGGAGYWKPSHGAYNTIWNLQVQVDTRFTPDRPLTLYGISDGPKARLIGIHGNQPLAIEYGPDPYIEGTNRHYSTVPSLYQYQLNQRLNQP